MTESTITTELKIEEDEVEITTRKDSLKQAVRYFEDALKIASQLKDIPNEARVQGKLGKVNSLLKEHDKAIKHFNAAIKLCKSIDDKRTEIDILLQIGKVYSTLKKEKDFLSSYQRAATLANNLGDTALEINCFGDIGLFFWSSSNLEAITWFEQAISLSQSVDDKRSQAYWLAYIGQCHHHSGDSKKAIVSYKKSMKLASEALDYKTEAMAYSHLGNTYLKDNMLADAIKNLETAIEIIEPLGYKSEHASYLGLLADAYYESGDIAEAKKNYEKSARSLKGTDDKKEFEIQLGKVGTALYSMDEYSKAIKHLAKAVKIAESIDEKQDSMEWYGLLAEVEGKKKDFENSIEHFEIATKLAISLKLKGKQALFTLGLGEVYEEMDDQTQASKLYTKALNLSKETPENFQAEVLTALGRAHYNLTRYDQAINYFNQAFIIMGTLEDFIGQVHVLEQQGKSYEQLEKYSKTITCYENALEIAKKIKDTTIRKKTVPKQMGNLGNIHYITKENGKAKTYFKDALKKAKENELRFEEGTWTGSLGKLALRDQNLKSTIDLYEKAIAIFRNLGNKIEEARWITELAYAFESQGSFKEAIELNEKAQRTLAQIDKTLSLKIYSNLGSEYFELKNYSSSIKNFKKALVIAQELTLQKQEEKVLSNMGKSYFQMNKFKNASESFENALTIAQDSKDRESQLYQLTQLGKINAKTDEEISIKYFQRAIQLAQKLGDTIQEEELYGNIANAYFEIDKIDLAKKNIENAIELAKTKERKSKWRIKLGDIYSAKNMHKEALVELKTAHKNISSMEPENKCELLSKLGICIPKITTKNDQIESAIKFLEEAIKIAGDSGIQEPLCKWEIAVSELYIDQNNLKKAEMSLESAKTNAAYFSDIDCEIEIAMNMADISSKKSESFNEIKYYEQALDLAKKLKYKDKQKTILKNIADVYQRQGDEEKAADYRSRIKGVK